VVTVLVYAATGPMNWRPPTAFTGVADPKPAVAPAARQAALSAVARRVARRCIYLPLSRLFQA
jgi:hypothetical protein